jgi:hypothetical protein
MDTEAIYNSVGLFLKQSNPDSPRRWTIEGDLLTIGRNPSSDIFIDDSSVSWHHADLIRRDFSWFIADATSTNGTYVGGSRVSESAIAADDQIRLGRIEFVVGESVSPLRGSPTRPVNLEAMLPSGPPPPAGGPPRTGEPPRTGGPPGTGEPGRPDIRIHEQHGQTVNNADRIYYIQQQRENFLREVAATKTKARWLVAAGFLAFVVGFGLFAYGDLSFLKQISDSFQNGSEPDSTISPFGHEVGGVPLGLLGWALGAVGAILLIVGIVLHIVVASRRKRVDREFPVPPPWAI